MSKKTKKTKFKTKKAVAKRVKITSSGKLMRSHQLRTGHLRRNKSKSALRRHARVVEIKKSDIRAVKKMLGI